MRWVLNDGSATAQHYADSVLALLQTSKDMQALVPSLWWLEVGNVLVKAEKKKWIKRQDSDLFLETLNELAIFTELESHHLLREVILPLASEHKLSVYDANYLGLCIARNAPLASLDQDLVRAARRSGVSILTI